MRYLSFIALLIAAGLAIALWWPPPGGDDGRRQALERAVAGATPGDTIDLVSVLGADWDRAIVFGGYHTNQSADAILGFPFDYERAADSDGTDTGSFVLLADGDEVVAWFNVANGAFLFDCLDGEEWRPEDGPLTVGHDGFGSRVLGPLERPNCHFETTP